MNLFLQLMNPPSNRGLVCKCPSQSTLQLLVGLLINHHWWHATAEKYFFLRNHHQVEFQHLPRTTTMVKSYLRFEPVSTLGSISSNSNVVWLPSLSEGSAKSKTGGRAIVAGLEELLIWDLKSSTLLSRWSDGVSKEEITIIAYEKTNDIVATGYSDGSIRVWDLKSGTVVVSFTGHKAAITALKFDSQGARLVSGSKDSNIVVWDLVEEVGLFKLKGHRNQITGLEILGENDEFLLTTSKDGLIKLWDLETQVSIETHIAHTGECWSLGTSKDKTIAITCGLGKEIKVWTVDVSAAEGSMIQERGSIEKVSNERGISVIFHPTQDYFAIASSDRLIEIFRQRSPEEIKKSISRKKKRQEKKLKKMQEDGETIDMDEFKEPNGIDVNEVYVPYTAIRAGSRVRGFDWTASKDSSHIDIVVNLANNSLEYYKISTEDRKQGADYNKLMVVDNAGHRSDIRVVTLSSDDKMVCSASNGQLKLWNIKTGSCLRSFETGYVLCAAFLPGDAIVVAGTKAGTLELYDVASSSIISSMETHNGQAIWSLDVSKDGQTLVTGGADKKVNFWKFAIEEELVPGTARTVPKMVLKLTKTIELTDDVLAVKLSPDGKLIAASLLDNTIKVYYTDTLKFFLSLYGHKLPVLSIDISHDSKILISSSADKNIKIWGLDFGDCHRSIFGHADSIMKVAFEPETHNFFSASKDKAIKYWDGDKFVNIQTLTGHHGEIWALAVANNGEFIVSASHDKSVRVWERTDEPLFIEEEKEKEMEELYESNLLQENEALEADGDVDMEDQGAVAKAGVQTMDTLKAGERLIEALEIGASDLDEIAAYEQRRKADPNMAAPVRNVILATLNISAERYVLNVLEKIKPSHLEDALLVLPFDKAVSLFRFMELWAANSWNMPLVCKVLAYTVQVHHKQIVASKNVLRQTIQNLRLNLRKALEDQKDRVGYNMAGIKYIKQTWDYSHKKEFLDETEHRDNAEKTMKKRAFTTLQSV